MFHARWGTIKDAKALFHDLASPFINSSSSSSSSPTKGSTKKGSGGGGGNNNE